MSGMYGWVDGRVNGWMDGSHRVIKAFCFSLTSELNSTSCVYAEPSIGRVSIQVCLTWRRQLGWMDTVTDRHSPAPAAQMGTESSVPWKGIACGCQAASWIPSVEPTQNKGWAVSIGPPHPINHACIYVTLQAWWRPDVTNDSLGCPGMLKYQAGHLLWLLMFSNLSLNLRFEPWYISINFILLWNGNIWQLLFHLLEICPCIISIIYQCSTI